MLAKLQARILELLGHESTAADTDRADGIQLATATLMAEVAQADGQFTDDERCALEALLTSRFSLSTEDCATVVASGVASAEHAVSLQGFTRSLHEALDDQEKARIVGMLWQVAAADGDIDATEDARIAQIGELLYVPRSIVLKLKAEAEADIARVSS
ncbi:MAG: TerB family tellurite resistance protein [Pseudomonadota bacterium]